MDATTGQVKALIVRLNVDRGWNRDFSQMTPHAKLIEFGIYHFRERSVWFNLFGSYIDITDLKRAVMEEFALEEYEDLREHYYKWSLVADVVDYVSQCLFRKEQKERIRQEREEIQRREHEERSKRAKDAWVRRKARERQEREERKRQEHERRSKAAKEAWAWRKAKERREREGSEQSHRSDGDGSRNKNSGGKNSSGRAHWLSILDLPPTASAEEIKTKYRELAKSAHPDHGGHPHYFRIIQMAYENLMGRKRS
jgi:hypothetical protein